MPSRDITIDFPLEISYRIISGRAASGPAGEPPVEPPVPETIEIESITLIFPSDDAPLVRLDITDKVIGTDLFSLVEDTLVESIS